MQCSCWIRTDENGFGKQIDQLLSIWGDEGRYSSWSNLVRLGRCLGIHIVWGSCAQIEKKKKKVILGIRNKQISTFCLNYRYHRPSVSLGGLFKFLCWEQGGPRGPGGDCNLVEVHSSPVDITKMWVRPRKRDVGQDWRQVRLRARGALSRHPIGPFSSWTLWEIRIQLGSPWPGQQLHQPSNEASWTGAELGTVASKLWKPRLLTEISKEDIKMATFWNTLT